MMCLSHDEMRVPGEDPPPLEFDLPITLFTSAAAPPPLLDR